MKENAARLLLILLLTAVAALRFHYCTELPANTGDIARHIYQGLIVIDQGPQSAARPISEVYPRLRGIAWATEPYNYPAVTLAFFTLLAALSPTIFMAKLTLTLIEALNSYLLYRLTGHRWLAALYWMFPASIWWASHEAQFEPLQNLFVFAALLALKRRSPWSLAFLALAVQVKLTAILLLPFVLLQLKPRTGKELLRTAVAALAGSAPTLIAMGFYPVLSQVLLYKLPLTYNPYYWDFFARKHFAWHPYWLIVWDQAASYGLLAALIVLAWIFKAPFQYAASILFVGICKAVTHAQFWYLALLPSFFASIQSRRVLLALFLLLPLLEIRSTVQIIFGPFGYTVGNYYRGISVFDELWIPR